MLKIKASASFKKAAKKLNDRDKGLLKEVLGKLVNNEKLDEKYCDHALKGKYSGFRDCHIKPDLVLIYKIEHNALLLYLANIGSHSELGI